jgi:hypothetical protein
VTPIRDAVTAFLKGDGWDFVEKENGTLLTRVRGESTAFHAVIVADDERSRLTVYALAPDAVAPAHLWRVTDFVSRANCGINVGNFEIDVKSGELRFKIGLDLHDVPPHDHLVKNLVYRAVFSFDGTWPGVAALLEQGASVDEALALVGTLQAARSADPGEES